MAILKNFVGKKNGIPTLKHLVDKLQRTLSLPSQIHGHPSSDAKADRRNKVPKDVKEGHFAVMVAINDGCPKRFVVALRYLNHPQFQKLLQKAAEEFGFDQEGALTINCRPSELERILSETMEGEERCQWWKRLVMWLKDHSRKIGEN